MEIGELGDRGALWIQMVMQQEPGSVTTLALYMEVRHVQELQLRGN